MTSKEDQLLRKTSRSSFYVRYCSKNIQVESDDNRKVTAASNAIKV